MHGVRSLRLLAICLVTAFGPLVGSGELTASAAVAPGQAAVSATDLEGVRGELDALQARLNQLPPSDARRTALQADLDRIVEELTYLRVKLRRGEPIRQAEYDQLHSLVDDVESSLDEAASRSGDDDAIVIPVGREIDVRLQTSLNSDSARVEDRFYATTVVDLAVAGELAVPAGSEVRGVVSAVDRSSRTDRSASLALTFDQLTVNGRTYPVRLTLTEALSSGIRDEADRIGIGAGVGGLIGGILGGVRGALTGILIGAGGTVAATEGEDVDLPAGTILRARFDAPVTVSSEAR